MLVGLQGNQKEHHFGGPNMKGPTRIDTHADIGWLPFNMSRRGYPQN